MIKPNIKWIGSPNFSSSTGDKKIAIVDHIMAGSLYGTDSWFQNPASQVSSHFGVGKNGEIHQYVDLKNPAWANGGVDKPNWPLLIPGVNPNYYTVSIEHEGYSGDVMPEAQYQATLVLHRWLIDVLGLEVTAHTIIGHYRIDSVNKSGCPGAGFPWDRLFKDLGGEVLDKPMLVVGSRGSVVDELQSLLNKRGANLTVDGDFGPATKKAVMQFQSSYGLFADGIVGSQMWVKLIGEVPTPAPQPVGDKDIYLSVRVLQSKSDTVIKQIIEMGYACKVLPLA
ncbi:MAG: N-acetylmuramoyl-L-alanine amidase [Janthinobacterium sp.]